LVCVDHGSKWLSATPICDKKTENLASIFEHRVLQCLPAMPKRVLTDNGKEFTSPFFATVLDKYGVQHVFSTPYKPSSNGLVERVNRTVSELLRCLGEDNPSCWVDNLAKVVVAYNHSWHSKLKMSPSDYLLRSSHKIKSTQVFPKPTPEYWRVGHPSFSPFKVGELILKKIHHLGHSTINKFKPRYEGPFRIVKTNPNSVTYVIETIDSSTKKQCKVHHSQLKLWMEAPTYLQEHPSYKVLARQRDTPHQAYESSTTEESSQGKEDHHELVSSSSSGCLDFSGFSPAKAPPRRKNPEHSNPDLLTRQQPRVSPSSTASSEEPFLGFQTSDTLPAPLSEEPGVIQSSCSPPPRKFTHSTPVDEERAQFISFQQEHQIDISVLHPRQQLLRESQAMWQDTLLSSALEILDETQAYLKQVETHLQSEKESEVSQPVRNQEELPKESAAHSEVPILTTPVICEEQIPTLKTNEQSPEKSEDAAEIMFENLEQGKQSTPQASEMYPNIVWSPEDHPPANFSGFQVPLSPVTTAEVKPGGDPMRESLVPPRQTSPVCHDTAIQVGEDSTPDFSGFQGTPPRVTTLRNQEPARRISLSPVWKSLEEANNIIKEYRRRSQAFGTLNRPNLAQLSSSSVEKENDLTHCGK
jgi:hypothetical protein